MNTTSPEFAALPIPWPKQDQGLFVIGAARSGTTVLQNALNDSHHIFLFGEPDFHDDDGAANFAARYNAMHRQWNNQENKSSFCPAFFPHDAPWHVYLDHVAGLHRHAGSKIVVTREKQRRMTRRLFDFQARYFYRSRYVFCFRDPLQSVLSVRGLSLFNGNQALDYSAALFDIATTMALYLRMVRNLPRVAAVFHDEPGTDIFAKLGAWLELDLSASASYYDAARIHRHALPNDMDEPARELLEETARCHALLREGALGGFARPQLEQNNSNFEAAHYTALGALANRIDALVARLDAPLHG